MDETYVSVDYTDPTGKWAKQYHTSEYAGLSTDEYAEYPEIEANEGYANVTDFYVKNYDTGLDAEYQEGSEYTDELPTGLNAEKMYYDSANTQYHSGTPLTDTFDLDKENYYEDQQNERPITAHGDDTDKTGATRRSQHPHRFTNITLHVVVPPGAR
ncbi:hypothetical protein K439DRAFT_1618792 [Ramaria rubella]|nr:hypothetical protein K439DRAFT_1618792 [Ramaria rubella]